MAEPFADLPQRQFELVEVLVSLERGYVVIPAQEALLAAVSLGTT